MNFVNIDCGMMKRASFWCYINFMETGNSLNSSPPGQNGRHFADGIFRCIFVNEKFCILIKSSLKSDWQYSSSGSDNGLAPHRRQAIIWTNADLIHWRIYAALGRDELINCGPVMPYELWSIFGQVMTYCLTAPSHNLIQCWFFVN